MLFCINMMLPRGSTVKSILYTSTDEQIYQWDFGPSLTMSLKVISLNMRICTSARRGNRSVAVNLCPQLISGDIVISVTVESSYISLTAWISSINFWRKSKCNLHAKRPCINVFNTSLRIKTKQLRGRNVLLLTKSPWFWSCYTPWREQ